MLGTLPSLRLDFSGSAHRIRRRTTGFALLAIVLLSIPLLAYRDLAVEISNIAAEDAAFAAKYAPASREAPPDQAEIEARAALDKVAIRLSVPWESLLDAVAAAIPDNVVLLSIQPNATRGDVTLMGAGTKIPAVLDFVERLKAQKSLKEVYLKNHETDEEEKGKFPVRFTILLRWGDVQ